MILGSLFDGISGFPLAASWAGIETKWISEIDPYCLKVSKKNFPNAIQYGDIKEIGKGRKWEPGAVDILTGGFPCQPFSVAGKRKGKDDNRFLWPEMLRIITEVRPKWVIGENVTGIISLALEEVLVSMEAQDYKTEVFIIPACAVNAPHRRDRVWIISHSSGIRRHGRGLFKGKVFRSNEKEATPSFERPDNTFIPDPSSQGLQKWHEARDSSKKKRAIIEGSESIGICSEGRAEQWEAEPGICRVVNGISNRVDRLKSLGNAIVPQIAYEIFKAIVAAENESPGNP